MYLELTTYLIKYPQYDYCDMTIFYYLKVYTSKMVDSMIWYIPVGHDMVSLPILTSPFFKVIFAVGLYFSCVH